MHSQLLKVFLWILGFLFGSSWSMLNFLLTIKLLKIAILKQDKPRLTLFLLVKFPLLYLGGALILVYHIFPLWSLLIGILAGLFAIGVMRICKKNYLI